jgi:hypothetical protein
MTKLVKMNIKMFLDELASSSPAPGGGSVAALSGALGAALSSMVCNLTRDKQGYEAVQDEIFELLQRSEELRKQLTGHQRALAESLRLQNHFSRQTRTPLLDPRRPFCVLSASSPRLPRSSTVPPR